MKWLRIGPVVACRELGNELSFSVRGGVSRLAAIIPRSKCRYRFASQAFEFIIRDDVGVQRHECPVWTKHKFVQICLPNDSAYLVAMQSCQLSLVGRVLA
jgi:hypothetical protein